MNREWWSVENIPLDSCFVIRLTRARNVKQFNYTLENTPLQETDSHSYLEVCVNKDLNLNKHQITGSANRTLTFIRRELHSCPINIKTTAYTTLVRPLLELSSLVWDPHTNIKWCKDAQPDFVVMNIHLE